MSDHSVCVIGQFNIDAVAADPDDGTYFRLSTNRLRFGGSVANFGEQARDEFARVYGVFAVGQDLAGDILASRADQLFDNHVPVQLTEENSGVVVVIFETDGRRMLGPRRHSALQMRSAISEPPVEELLRKSDAVVVDGYFLLEKGGPDLARTALNTARNCGALAVLDLVPHDLPRHIQRADFESVTKSADVIVGELRTIAPFFDTEEDAGTVGRHLLTTNPRLTSILRYGNHNIGINHILSQKSESIDRHKGSPGELTEFGYGDRLMARQLAAILRERS